VDDPQTIGRDGSEAFIARLKPSSSVADPQFVDVNGNDQPLVPPFQALLVFELYRLDDLLRPLRTASLVTNERDKARIAINELVAVACAK